MTDAEIIAIESRICDITEEIRNAINRISGVSVYEGEATLDVLGTLGVNAAVLTRISNQLCLHIDRIRNRHALRHKGE